MNKIAYPQGYRQYRPKRTVKKRATSLAPAEPEQVNDTKPNQNEPEERHQTHGARNNSNVAEQTDFMDIDHPLPSTPVRPPGNLPTPETRRALRPRWQETTSSQIGVPFDSLDDEDIEPVWEDSIINVYDESELPKRTNVGLSRITSSRLENCETKNVKMIDVAALNNRRLEDMEVIGLDERRLKYRRIEGRAVDLEKFNL